MDEFIARQKKLTETTDKKNYDFFVPDNLLSPKGRREFRIQFFLLTPEFWIKRIRRRLFGVIRTLMGILMDRKMVKFLFLKDRGLFKYQNLEKLAYSNPVDRHYVENLDSNKKKKLNKLKFFLWPNYRLEDLACMNRYWFNTTDGSRFSMLRIYMYRRVQICY